MYGLTGIGQQYMPSMNYANQMGQFAGNAGGMIGNELARGGWDQGLANRINQTGGSFDPYNNPALMQSIAAGNQELIRQFNQGVMPQMNQQFNAAGPGAYGGTRAGVAEGIARQGLTDAISKQTSDRLAQGYESGLNRYVTDRGNTLNTALGAGSQYNDMFRFGFNALPQIYQQAWQAGMAPGQVTQNYGQALGTFGGMQQQNNQNQINWGNQQWNAAMDAPYNTMTRFAALANPYLQPANTGGQFAPQQPSTAQNVLGGAMTGYGIYDQWRQGQGGGGYTGGMPNDVYNAARGQTWWQA